jgi:CRP-like cAMP-binding protein
MSFEGLRPDPSRLIGRRMQFKDLSCFKVLNVASPFRLKWDTFIIALAVFNTFSVSFRFAFEPESFSDADNIVETSIIDLCFVADLLLNFRRSFINSKTGDEIMDPKQICLHYLRSPRFLVDLLTTIPWDKFIYLVTLGSKFSFNKASGLNLIRILRVFKLNRLIAKVQVRDDIKVVLRITQLIFYIFMYVHIIACCWYSLINVEKTWFPPSDGKTTNLYDSGTSMARKYMFCLYHSVYFFRGVETNPSTPYEVFFLIVVILFGSIISALMFGQMSVLMRMLARSRLQFAELMETAQTTMKNIKLDEQLQYKISDYLYATQNILAKKEEIEHFEKIISPSLQQEVNGYIYRLINDECPLLNEVPGLATALINKLSNRFVQPESDLTVQGEEGTEFYYVAVGICAVEVVDEHKDPHLIKYLHAGQYFGEIALVFNTVRTAKVSSVGYCNIAVLSGKHFRHLSQTYPQMVKFLKKNANKYMDHWKIFMVKCIDRVPYFTGLNDEIRNAIMYNLEVSVYSKSDTLYESGKVADKIYILVEGKVRLYATLNSAKFSWLHAKMYNKSEESIESRPAVRTAKYASRMTMLNKDRRENMTMCAVKLESLTIGDIMCAKQALVGATFAITCRVAEPTTFMCLPMHKLEKIAKSYPKLKACIDKAKGELMYRDSESGEVVRDVPLIDVSKDFQDKDKMRLWTNMLRFKNRALAITFRKRTLHMLKISDIKGLVIKLKAINQANDAGYPDLARKIANGEADIEAVKTIGILDSREMADPLLTQFAVKVASVREVSTSVDTKLVSIADNLKLKQQHLISLKDNLSQTRKILQFLDDHLRTS